MGVLNLPLSTLTEFFLDRVLIIVIGGSKLIGSLDLQIE